MARSRARWAASRSSPTASTADRSSSTGFGDDDLQLCIDALRGMFDLDRSAARGQMASRKLFAFEHSSPLGNAPAAGLFERIVVKRNDPARPPRAFSDYAVTVNRDGLPAGVTLHELL
jgi:CRISPR-associated protein Csd2